MSKTLLNDELFISGDSSRLFLNLELGCSSSCSYCYLPVEGMQVGKRPPQLLSCSPDELLRRLYSDRRFVPGRNGTILSIGCFSECWDSVTRPKTIQLIEGLLAHDNWIQFATKREIRQVDLELIVKNPNWRNQAVAYISSASIRKWSEVERGTTRPEKRFKSFSICNLLGVHSFLYIKPVLPGVTIHDIDLYGQLMVQYEIDAVVGDLFVSDVSAGNAISPISKFLSVTEHTDAAGLREGLARYGRVFENSTEHLLNISR